MTRARWLRRINREYRKAGFHRRMVQTQSDDPRWAELGDYFVINTRTGRVVLSHVRLVIPPSARRGVIGRAG